MDEIQAWSSLAKIPLLKFSYLTLLDLFVVQLCGIKLLKLSTFTFLSAKGNLVITAIAVIGLWTNLALLKCPNSKLGK